MLFRDNDGEQPKKAPVVQGQLINLKLLGTGSRGDLFGKLSGFIIFVHGANQSDLDQTIPIEITEVREKYAFAKKV
jgi:predicted RNA-binding protein with TRAM domain